MNEYTDQKYNDDYDDDEQEAYYEDKNTREIEEYLGHSD